MLHLCFLCAPPVLPVCTTCASSVLPVCSLCDFHVLHLCSKCAPRVLLMCSTCAPPVLLMCSICAHQVLYLCSSCAPPVLPVCSTCAPRVLHGQHVSEMSSFRMTRSVLRDTSAPRTTRVTAYHWAARRTRTAGQSSERCVAIKLLKNYLTNKATTFNHFVFKLFV